jgi:hypothetical protein
MKFNLAGFSCDGGFDGRRFQGNRQFSWWNPFGKTGIRDTNPQLVSSKTKSETDDVDHPRKIQERKDATLILLALQFRKASFENPNLPREEVVDIAFDRLHEMDVDSKTLLQLRHSLQSALEGQVIDLFKIFRKIDEGLLYFAVQEEEENDIIVNNEDTEGLSLEGRTSEIEKYCEEILGFELERTIDELANPSPAKAPKGADPKEFLKLKRGAIERVLDQKRKVPQLQAETTNSNESAPSSAPEQTKQPQKDISWADADEFGYHESIDEERNRLIRYYQTINLCRSAKLRDEWGFSVIALQSSIPGAGRGVYGKTRTVETISYMMMISYNSYMFFFASSFLNSRRIRQSWVDLGISTW